MNAFHFPSLSFVNGFWIGWIWSVLKIPFVTHLLLMAKTPKWEMEIPWKWWELIDFCIFYAELNTSMIMSMLMRCEIDLLSFREREIERDVETLVPFDSLWFPGDLRLVRLFYTKLGCNAGFVDGGEKKFDECCATCNHIRINYGRLKILSLSLGFCLSVALHLCVFVCVWMCVWWHRAACNWNFCHAKSPISFYH